MELPISPLDAIDEPDEFRRLFSWTLVHERRSAVGWGQLRHQDDVAALVAFLQSLTEDYDDT